MQWNLRHNDRHKWNTIICYSSYWAIQVLRTEVGGLIFPGKKRYEGVRFNVISITWGWVGVKYPGEMRYLTLEQINCQVTDNQCVVKIYRSRSKCRSFVSAIKVKLKLLSS